MELMKEQEEVQVEGKANFFQNLKFLRFCTKDLNFPLFQTGLLCHNGEGFLVSSNQGLVDVKQRP